MPSIPFTAYDFFAYLSAGFVVIGAADFAFSTGWILDADLTFIEGLVWVVLAYVLGHVISALSAPVLEQRFAEGRLGPREEVLFGLPEGKRKGLRYKLFPGYFHALPDEIREMVLERARKETKLEKPGRALFMYCDAHTRQRKETAPILAIFLNISGFARNTCLAAVFAATLLGIGALTDDADRGTKALLALAAVAAAIGLLYRYLKFFRLYAREAFLFYAIQEPAKPPEE
ncbi:MAG: hypothetical protein ACRDM2_04680 [Gaiellaceae bacterium]